MYSGRKPHAQPDPPPNDQTEPSRVEQQDPQDYEQGLLQGGGRSNPAPERDGISPPVPTRSIEEYIDLSAAQNITGGGSIGHTDTSHNTTSKSGNTATTESNNTVNNSRAYDHTEHNEITHSEFHGGLSLGAPICSLLQ
ncbi:hypothetical protein BDD12DRAFT_809591 [Trichophaea hybrida]|nr:hypothetical protein BDD12DRAFT_809591 [Trichophaea hybrida]